MELANNEQLIQAVAMDNYVAALEGNAEKSVRYKMYGLDLIANAKTGTITECLAKELTSYVDQCGSLVKTLHEKRRPFTDQLVAIQKQFVAVENAIDPKKPGSPAYQCGMLLDAYFQERLDEITRQRERLEMNHQRTMRRIQSRTDLTEEARRAAIERADNRRVVGQQNLDMRSIDAELLPRAFTPNGYIELFKFWWENVGKGLPDEELRRVFHPMLQYAKRQARADVRIDSPDVTYVPTPKRKQAVA